MENGKYTPRADESESMKLKSCTKTPDELEVGLNLGRVCFKHTHVDNRSGMDRVRYDTLKKDLLKNGMRHPLIIYKDRVIIGMRRFEILAKKVQQFDCLEVKEDLSKWSSSSVLGLIKTVNLAYKEIDRAA